MNHKIDKIVVHKVVKAIILVNLKIHNLKKNKNTLKMVI